MGRKIDIIGPVKNNKPVSIPLPEIPNFTMGDEDLVSKFCAALDNNHAKTVLLHTLEKVQETITTLFPKAVNIVSRVACFRGNINPMAGEKESLTAIDLAILQGKTGIAENGAIWISDKDTDIRALPFVAEHLVVLISRKDLVNNMYDACTRIDFSTGYGVFISGPSKTADIEQSLVIGAHGPRSHTVIIVDE